MVFIKRSSGIKIQSPQQAVRKLRFVWMGLLASQLIFLVVAAVVIARGEPVSSTSSQQWVQAMFLISVVLLVSLVAVGYIVRKFIYESGQEKTIVSPRAYFTGNLVLLGECEAIAIFSLVVTMLSGTFGLAVLPAVIAMVVQAINFPTVRPMQSDELQIGIREP